jgi:carboxylate-amine ligase
MHLHNLKLTIQNSKLFMMRRLGLEQEFFVVNRDGELVNRADDLLHRCWELAEEQGRSPDNAAPEFVKSMLELKTPPAKDLADLTRAYLNILEMALQAATELELRLYPLSTYPLHALPVMRDKPLYHLQTRTFGAEPYENAARCTGTHLHLELPPGSLDRQVAVAYEATANDRAEVLHLHNLATAIDPALIALSRACPFYEGRVTGLAMRIVHYRGSEYYGWSGVFSKVQAVGGLMPYAESVEQLVELYFQRYHTWLQAMERAGVDRHLFLAAGGELLTAGWNPVRLNRLGTLELRSMDSNYPDVVLSLVSLVVDLAQVIRTRHLVVMPRTGQRILEHDGDHLWVPEFSFLNGELLYAAVTEGVTSGIVQDYLDSVLGVLDRMEDPTTPLVQFRHHSGAYTTTERQILEQFAPPTDHLSREEGLQLVRQACDRLDAQVKQLGERLAVGY